MVEKPQEDPKDPKENPPQTPEVTGEPSPATPETTPPAPVKPSLLSRLGSRIGKIAKAAGIEPIPETDLSLRESAKRAVVTGASAAIQRVVPDAPVAGFDKGAGAWNDMITAAQSLLNEKSESEHLANYIINPRQFYGEDEIKNTPDVIKNYPGQRTKTQSALDIFVEKVEGLIRVIPRDGIPALDIAIDTSESLSPDKDFLQMAVVDGKITAQSLGAMLKHIKSQVTKDLGISPEQFTRVLTERLEHVRQLEQTGLLRHNLPDVVNGLPEGVNPDEHFKTPGAYEQIRTETRVEDSQQREQQAATRTEWEQRQQAEATPDIVQGLGEYFKRNVRAEGGAVLIEAGSAEPRMLQALVGMVQPRDPQEISLEGQTLKLSFQAAEKLLEIVEHRHRPRASAETEIPPASDPASAYTADAEARLNLAGNLRVFEMLVRGENKWPHTRSDEQFPGGSKSR